MSRQAQTRSLGPRHALAVRKGNHIRIFIHTHIQVVTPHALVSSTVGTGSVVSATVFAGHRIFFYTDFRHVT